MYTVYTYPTVARRIVEKKVKTECAEYIRRHADTNFQTSWSGHRAGKVGCRLRRLQEILSVYEWIEKQER